MNWMEEQLHWTQEQLAAHGCRKQPKGTGRIRPPKGMNGLESRYSAHLAMREQVGEVALYRYEGITLKLGDDLRFTPDFFVMLADGSIQFHETKGHWRDDAKVKIKVAASLFPFQFIAVFAEKDGGWRYEYF